MALLLPALIAGLAGALVAVGSLVDWSGVSYSSRVDRGLALAAGLLLIVVAVLGVAWHRRTLVAALPPAALALDMGVVNYHDIANRLHEYGAYPAARVGVGVYLVIAGAVLGVLAGLVGLAPGRWLNLNVEVEDRSVERR